MKKGDKNRRVAQMNEVPQSMKGLYTYCIRSRYESAKKIRARSVVFGSHVSLVSFKDIQAVVSEIDAGQFGEKKIKDLLQNDEKWTEKNVRRHHEVIQEASKTGTVIPWKFGTIFKTKKSLEVMLKKHYRKFKNILARLKDKQEWGVKGYLEYEKFARVFKNKNKEIQKLEKKRSKVSEGMKWYVDRKSNELISGQIEGRIEEELQRIVDKLEKQTEEIRLNNLLPKEVGELSKDMILNAACLVRNDHLVAFQSLLQGLIHEYEALGIALILTGPWPPYNFVHFGPRE